MLQQTHHTVNNLTTFHKRTQVEPNRHFLKILLFIFLHTVQIVEIYSFVFCPFPRSKRPDLLVCSRFLTFDRFVQFYTLVVRVHPPLKMA